MDEKKPAPEKPVEFYYSREHRLARASPAVRALNEGALAMKPGLFRSLTSTKPMAFLFVSVITLCVAMILLSRYVRSDNDLVLGGNTLKASAISAGGASYVTIKKTFADQGEPYTGAVDLAVSPKETPEDPKAPPIDVRRIYFTLEGEEIFRFSVPFTGDELILLFQAEEEQGVLRIKPE
ncbi:hypothetical protein FACS189468_5010 [Spirochaetia bacterium]|nr:hypothetical protein FACS189468_5010 [Spirochaetia bacterium]